MEQEERRGGNEEWRGCGEEQGRGGKEKRRGGGEEERRQVDEEKKSAKRYEIKYGRVRKGRCRKEVQRKVESRETSSEVRKPANKTLSAVRSEGDLKEVRKRLTSPSFSRPKNHSVTPPRPALPPPGTPDQTVPEREDKEREGQSGKGDVKSREKRSSEQTNTEEGEEKYRGSQRGRREEEQLNGGERRKCGFRGGEEDEFLDEDMDILGCREELMERITQDYPEEEMEEDFSLMLFEEE
ncbi:hypothetical protein UPYG_G00246450 [Umbra pygmaea]|uniref:Uncharacterized protein n=1 Tax=Umbra pygmaea TaxID=75934 RepID=A0ABD0WLD5_UMBPY